MPSSPGLLLVFANELSEGDLLAFDLGGPLNFLERHDNDGEPYVVYHEVTSVDSVPGNDSSVAVTLQQISTLTGDGGTQVHNILQLGPCFVLVGNPERLV